jgi:hypothetical protein
MIKWQQQKSQARRVVPEVALTRQEVALTRQELQTLLKRKAQVKRVRPLKLVLKKPAAPSNAESTIQVFRINPIQAAFY